MPPPALFASVVAAAIFAACSACIVSFSVWCGFQYVRRRTRRLCGRARKAMRPHSYAVGQRRAGSCTAIRCDTPLLLDEPAQLDPKAAEEIRIAEIPADAGVGLGVFEDLRGEANGADFARALDRALRKYHGTAFSPFLDALVRRQDEIADALRDVRKAFARRYLTEDASSQARRVAERFALVGAAGELPTRMGITGWQGGAAIVAAGVCFEAWLSQRAGEGNQEERAMLAQVRGFLERHGVDRLTELWRPVAKDDHAPRAQNLTGWSRRVEESQRHPTRRPRKTWPIRPRSRNRCADGSKVSAFPLNYGKFPTHRGNALS
jgi:hypothetical protein